MPENAATFLLKMLFNFLIPGEEELRLDPSKSPSF